MARPAPSFANYVRAINPGARIVIYGSTAGNEVKFNATDIFLKSASIVGSQVGDPQDFQEMLAFADKHEIKPVIERTFPLAEAKEALLYLQDSTLRQDRGDDVISADLFGLAGKYGARHRRRAGAGPDDRRRAAAGRRHRGDHLAQGGSVRGGGGRDGVARPLRCAAGRSLHARGGGRSGRALPRGGRRVPHPRQQCRQDLGRRDRQLPGQGVAGRDGGERADALHDGARTAARTRRRRHRRRSRTDHQHRFGRGDARPSG